MTAMIALAVAAAAAYFGHIRMRGFSRRRLRYTRVAEHPAISGLAVGIGTAVLATPLVALMPIIGTGTAMALGLGVGTGVSSGVRDRLD